MNEEDIKILEEYLKNSAYKEKDSDFFKDGGWEIVGLEIPQALENLIKAYKADKHILKNYVKVNKELHKDLKNLETKNKELEKENNILKKDFIDMCKLKNVIPKSKIKEKIEELEKEYKIIEQSSDFIIADTIQPKIQVLKELLEKR